MQPIRTGSSSESPGECERSSEERLSLLLRRRLLFPLSQLPLAFHLPTLNSPLFLPFFPIIFRQACKVKAWRAANRKFTSPLSFCNLFLLSVSINSNLINSLSLSFFLSLSFSLSLHQIKTAGGILLIFVKVLSVESTSWRRNHFKGFCFF